MNEEPFKENYIEQMSRIYLPILLLVVVMFACKKQEHYLTIAPSNDYAQGFAVASYDGYKVVEVRNPWDTLKVLQRYILVPKNRTIPEQIPQGAVIRTPVEKAVVFASLHCGMLSTLSRSEAIVGVCDAHYVADETLKARVATGEVVDLGSSFLPDMESMILTEPEVIILSPYEDRTEDKAMQLGVPVVEMSDYMENTPLARAEWIKFLALLFDCEQVADSIFANTLNEYESLAEIGRKMENCPTLFCELKTGGVWYQPGGESYMAQMYRDAGINYLWSDNRDKGSISLSFEEVLSKGSNANLWFIKYAEESDKSLKSLASEYAPYANFRAYKDKSVWGVNALKVPFYEEMPLYPQYVLRDLMLIAHPQLFEEGDTTRYYKRLNNE